MLLHLVLVLCLVLPLASCDQGNLLDQAASEEPGITARHYADLIQGRKIDEIYEHLLPSLKTEATRAALVKAAGQMSDAAPRNVRLVGYNSFTLNGVTSRAYTFETEYPVGWALTNVVLEETGGGFAVMGLHTQGTTQSAAEANRFGFQGKGPLHYLFFALLVANPLFMLVTAVYAFRTPMRRRKWLWMLFILIGLFRVQFNWATGQLGFGQFLGFQILGSGMVRAGGFGAWILYLSLPLGAVTFLWRRSRLVADARAAAR